MRRTLAASAMVLLIALPSWSTEPARAAAMTGKLHQLQHIPMRLANEIAFDKRRIYVNQFSIGDDIGVHAFKTRRDGKLSAQGMLHCPGITDASPLGNGLIALGLQSNGDSCTDVNGGEGGVHIGDMSDPSKPRLLGDLALPGGVHTLTRYPGSGLVYTSMGGTETSAASGGITHIVDTSEPAAPRVAAEYTSPLNPGGCHDILFERIDKELIGFCPGMGGTEIWDASDPLAPEPIGRMHLPALQLPHQVAVSSDGKVAAVGDEAFVLHGCTSGAPLGGLWFYDISDLTNPRLLGFYGPRRGGAPVGSLSGNPLSCTAHNFNFIPDSRMLVVSWIAGGTNVIDISDPAAPVEVAHYRPDDAVTMSAYWYRGYIYVADFERGVEVLRLKVN